MGGYRQAIVRAFPYTIPVLAGYLFIGAAFGVMFADQGYNVLWAVLMSVVVYAGSGQYLATNFFVPGMSILQAVFLTVMVNIRHVFYGLSLVDRYNRFGRKRWYLIFGMTDETYSLVCTTGVPEDVDEEKFLLSITLLNQLYWILGTVIGSLAFTIISFDSTGIEFAMTDSDVHGAVVQALQSSRRAHRDVLCGSVPGTVRRGQLRAADDAADGRGHPSREEEAGRQGGGCRCLTWSRR